MQVVGVASASPVAIGTNASAALAAQQRQSGRSENSRVRVRLIMQKTHSIARKKKKSMLMHATIKGPLCTMFILSATCECAHLPDISAGL